MIRRRVSNNWLEQKNLPKRLWNCVGLDIDHEARPKLKDWLAKCEMFQIPNSGLFISGPSKASETILSVIFKELLRMCHDAYCISAIDLVDFVRTGYGDAINFENMDLISEVPFLAIYNFGKEMGDEFTRSVLNRLLNRRRDGELPMIISTSLCHEGFRDTYETQIVDAVCLSCEEILVG